MRLVFVLGLLLAACVDDSLEVGDDRARRACDDAITILSPPIGCTTLTVVSTSPYGCLDPARRIDHAGTWVRVSNAADLGSTLRITQLSSTCLVDGGATCAATATIRAFSGTPCSCELGSTTVHSVTAPIEISMNVLDEEVLLEPVGSAFEIRVCAPSP